MIAATTLVLDTTGLKPIQPSGFVPPSQRTSYSDPLVQDFLREAFEGQFPKLESVEETSALYRHQNPSSGSLVDCVTVRAIDEIPQAEVMRLLQGWITLRRIVMEATAPEGVRSLLMNLRIPDPRVAPHFYRISGPKTDERKLYILIGFEGAAAPSVALEEGIAAMLNVKPSQLESLLATSMASSNSVPNVAHTAPTAVEPSAHAKKPSSGVKNASRLCASAALLIFAVGIVWKMNVHPSVTPVSPLVAAAPQPIATVPRPADPAPPLSLPAVALAEPAPPPAPPLSRPAPLPTLETMSTGTQPGMTTPPATSQPIAQDADLTHLMAQ